MPTPITRMAAITLVSLSTTVVFGDIVVESTSPSANALAVDPRAAIQITFDAEMDAGGLTGREFYVFGQWSGVARGTIQLMQDGRTLVFTPDHAFLAGERVTVEIGKSLAAADGTILGRGYAWQFWVASKPGRIKLTETGRITVRQSGETWIQTYGAYAADFDEDGHTDLVVPNEITNDIRVFMNDGAGGYGPFDVYKLTDGARPSTNEAADFNRDGHADFAVGNSQGAYVSVFMGDGTGKLSSDRSHRVGSGVRGLAVLDLNGDAYPDIVTANRNAGTVSILINDRAGGFKSSESLDTPSFGETAAAAADMNEDGLLDVVVGSLESGDVHVLLSTGGGDLVVHDREPAGPGVWMIASGDVNADGHADVVTANSDANSVSVLFGDGQGRVTRTRTYPSSVFPLAIDLGDIDGDGDLDMVSSNFGSEFSGVPGNWLVFENTGGGLFEQASRFITTGAGSCAVLHDRDGDGVVDITAIDELNDDLVFFTNTPVATALEQDLPQEAPVMTAYPNPFSSSVNIVVPHGRSTPDHIEIFDATGRFVTRLDPASKPDRDVVWEGMDASGRPVAPGLYLIRHVSTSRISETVVTFAGR